MKTLHEVFHGQAVSKGARPIIACARHSQFTNCPIATIPPGYEAPSIFTRFALHKFRFYDLVNSTRQQFFLSFPKEPVIRSGPG